MGRLTTQVPAKMKGKTEILIEQEDNLNKIPAHSLIEVLMNAARTGNSIAILKLYSQKITLTARDEDGNTALHHAAMNGHSLICRLLIVFCTPFKLWTIKNNNGLLAEEVASTEEIQLDLHSLEHITLRKEDVNSKENDFIVNSVKFWRHNAKVLLSLDGGGIKVLVLLQMLIYLDSCVKDGIVSKLDWIAGTSCGGVSALLLGQEHKLEDMRHFFFEQRSNVFCGNKNRYPKHNVSGFQQAAQTIFGLESKMDCLTKKILVTVADTKKTPPTLLLFRSYTPNVSKEILQKHDYFEPSRILLWKAARCTSAAPYFFESYNGLSDGGLVANNPTQALMADFFNQAKLERHYGDSSDYEKESVGVLISLGTGTCPTEKTNGIDLKLKKIDKKNPIQLAKGLMRVINTAKNAFNLLIKEVTSSNGTPVRYGRAWCHSLNIPYFRFSPPFQMDVPLDCTDFETIINMMWDTEIYIRGTAYHEIHQLARLLELKPKEQVEVTCIHQSEHSI